MTQSSHTFVSPGNPGRFKIENLGQDYPVLVQLDAYPRQGAGSFGDANVSDLVDWVSANPPVPPDSELRDFALARIDEREEAMIAWLDDAELIEEAELDNRSRGSSSRNPYELIDSISTADRILRLETFAVVQAMQSLREFVHSRSQYGTISDDEEQMLQDAIEQAEIDPEIATHITRDRYNLMVWRQPVPNLLDDPDAAWREYQRTFETFSTAVPICIICKEQIRVPPQ